MLCVKPLPCNADCAVRPDADAHEPERRAILIGVWCNLKGVERAQALQRRSSSAPAQKLEGSIAATSSPARLRDRAPQRTALLASSLRWLKPQLLLWRQRRNVGRDQLRCHILEPHWGPFGLTVLVDDERAHTLDELAILE